MDLLYLVILGYLIAKATSGINSISDVFVCFLVGAILYFPVKIIPHCIIGGWTYPVNPDLRLHFISGTIAFVLVGLFLGLVIYCKTYNTSLPAIFKKLKQIT